MVSNLCIPGKKTRLRKLKINQKVTLFLKNSLSFFFFCRDQSFTTAVTTSTFPNMHTFLRGPEFCFMVRKLFSSCRTSKNMTLEEQYPHLCHYLASFPQLCPDDMHVSMIENFEDLALNPSVDVLSVLISNQNQTLKAEGLKLIRLLHRYARENLILANIYIKDPAVTMITRDQKIPVIWFVANVGGILGLCMGCSLVTIFEVLHHLILIFLRTGVKSVNRIHKTIRCVPRPNEGSASEPSGLTMAAFMQMGLQPQAPMNSDILTPSQAALLIKNQHSAVANPDLERIESEESLSIRINQQEDRRESV